jgi:hypothetical protein
MARALLLRDSATAASSKRRESCRAYSVMRAVLVLHLHVTGYQSIFIMARCDFYSEEGPNADSKRISKGPKPFVPNTRRAARVCSSLYFPRKS